MSDKEKLYVEIQTLQEQVKYLREHIQKFDQQIEEMESISSILDQMIDIKAGTEIKLPIAAGIFVNAKITRTDPLLVNVGSQIAVEKTVEDTQDLLDEQKKELESLKQQVISDHDGLIDRFNDLKEKLNNV